ncbi:hypothetical protein FB45DRAFT_906190 [Roridomyces roridus]|uniref:Uncharacterized protein n=1 Tax=Roridomyces roridus TaxID=1738132 RepID=A0AAD7FPQ4_9AGAR|nr:hypothetical protein FB45DRAFT_906190 [Roridomyces roridus]
MLSTFLLSPPVRVYAFRLLLLADIAAVVALELGVAVPYTEDTTLALVTFVEIFVHHVLVLFKLPFVIPACLDLFVLAGEIGMATYLVVLSSLSPPLTPLLVLLLVTAAFRVATIRKSKAAFLRQPFDFFGGCADVYPRYSLLTIFLNRSLTRPLVRGESIFILFARPRIRDIFHHSRSDECCSVYTGCCEPCWDPLVPACRCFDQLWVHG